MHIPRYVDTLHLSFTCTKVNSPVQLSGTSSPFNKNLGRFANEFAEVQQRNDTAK